MKQARPPAQAPAQAHTGKPVQTPSKEGTKQKHIPKKPVPGAAGSLKLKLNLPPKKQLEGDGIISAATEMYNLLAAEIDEPDVPPKPVAAEPAAGREEESGLVDTTDLQERPPAKSRAGAFDPVLADALKAFNHPVTGFLAQQPGRRPGDVGVAAPSGETGTPQPWIKLKTCVTVGIIGDGHTGATEELVQSAATEAGL